MYKMPVQFLPDSLNPKKDNFIDDAHALPPIPGTLVGTAKGVPDVFIPGILAKLDDFREFLGV